MSIKKDTADAAPSSLPVVLPYSSEQVIEAWGGKAVLDDRLPEYNPNGRDLEEDPDAEEEGKT